MIQVGMSMPWISRMIIADDVFPELGGGEEDIEVARTQHGKTAMAALQGGRGDAEGFAAEILFSFTLEQGERVVHGVAGGAEVGDHDGKI